MYRFRSENSTHLQRHNILISEFNLPTMSTPPARKVIHLPRVRMAPRGGAGGGRPSIRITNVKSIKPPDPEAVRRQEEEKLRAQLQKEIMSRSRACAYRRYACTWPVVAGRAYCVRHVTCDPGAPFVRCARDRCPMPAPAPAAAAARTGTGADADHPLCFEHARAAMLARHRASAPPPPVASTETLLTQLQHYVRPERTRTASCASCVSVVSEPAEPEPQPHAAAVDPFKQIDATAVNGAYSTSIMECASGSESDADSIVLTGAEPDSGGEPEDAPAEDAPLWRAGVFTAEEAVGEANHTLRALQEAYVRQMGRLKVLLQTARLQYLRALKREREHYCSIWSWQSQGALTARERRQLRKLKAFAGYRRRHGVHAVLARKLLHKRAKVNEPTPLRPPAAAGRCLFAEGGVRCVGSALPAAKHCLKHIASDAHQVLFTPCGDPRGGVGCREPVPRPPRPAACRYHTHPPPYTVFTPKKDDSDSESMSDASTDTETGAGVRPGSGDPSMTALMPA